MANQMYSNFVIGNEIEDQYTTMLDLQGFCTVDNSLDLAAGMTKKIHKYSATSGTEKLAMGAGNSSFIETAFDDADYTVACAQNTFKYYDEEAMSDPMVVTTGINHMAVDMFNTVNADIVTELATTTQNVPSTGLSFGDFVDAAALINVPFTDKAPEETASRINALVNPADIAGLRKSLNADLKYVEAFARTGYIGTVAGINVYSCKAATAGKVLVAAPGAITVFNKKGIEVEQERVGDTRQNVVISRKYYIAALTDDTQACTITITQAQ